MENASKALLIAGGVLLAMLILALMVYVFTGMSDMMDDQDTKKLNQQIQAFNAEYEAYNKKILYGADIISVYNKVIDNNNRYKDNDKYKIDIVVKGQLPIKAELDENAKKEKKYPNLERFKTLNYDDVNSMRGNYQFKTTIFTCKKMDYSDTGRIKKLQFEMIPSKESE